MLTPSAFLRLAACCKTVLRRRNAVLAWLLDLLFLSVVSMILTFAPRVRKAWIRPGPVVGLRMTADKAWSSSSCENCPASCPLSFSFELLKMLFSTFLLSGFLALRSSRMFRAWEMSSSLTDTAGCVGAGRTAWRWSTGMTPAFRIRSLRLTLRSMIASEMIRISCQLN